MIDKLINGISLFLHTNFPDFEIYIEGTDQGLELPCFCIYQGNSISKRRIGLNGSHYNETDFNIVILSDNKRQLRNTAEYILQNMDIIHLEDKSSILVRDISCQGLSPDADRLVIEFKFVYTSYQDMPEIPPVKEFKLNSELINE